MKKIIAVILLVVGIGLSALGVYGYVFSEDHARCLESASRATELLAQSLAAKGTSREAELLEKYRSESAVEEMRCRYSRQTRRNGMSMGLGGLASIIASVALLVISRKRTA